MNTEEYFSLLAIEAAGNLNPVQRDILNRYKTVYGMGPGSSSSSSASSIPPFSFDWEAARKAAFDPDNPSASPLGKYYLQKLDEAGGI